MTIPRDEPHPPSLPVTSYSAIRCPYSAIPLPYSPRLIMPDGPSAPLQSALSNMSSRFDSRRDPPRRSLISLNLVLFFWQQQQTVARPHALTKKSPDSLRTIRRDMPAAPAGFPCVVSVVILVALPGILEPVEPVHLISQSKAKHKQTRRGVCGGMAARPVALVAPITAPSRPRWLGISVQP